MPCPQSGSNPSPVTGQPISDWHGVHPYVPSGGQFSPKTLRELVLIVQTIEAAGSQAKAVGSIASLSPAPDSNGFVIHTDRLNRHLSQPFPMPPFPLASARFRTPAHNAQWLGLLGRFGAPQSGKSLVHVEAGIKIKDLLADLASMGLALPTMGAAGLQSLAGALATGTHGSDVTLPPLCDFVRAVHLVGPGGQEWWIESSAGPGMKTDYTQLPDWCSDTKVVRDTDFLESVIVGVGRFGVIYSMVLEVVNQYILEEHVDKTTWSDARALLLTAVASGYTTPGNVFAAPFNGLPLRFWSVDFNPNSGEAWITRRWISTTTSAVGLEKKTGLLQLFCTNPDLARDAAEAGTLALTTLLAGLAVTAFNEFINIPVAGPFLAADAAAPYKQLSDALSGALANFSTVGEYLATVFAILEAWSGRDLFSGEIHNLFITLISSVANESIKSAHDPSLRRGPSEKILDHHDYDLDHCFSADSSEFFFDANSASYIAFVDEVFDKSKSLAPIMGYVALRFLLGSKSKIGMEQFPLTVAVEVAILRPGNVNEQYMQTVHSLALSHGGIPHWGQEHALTKTQVEQIYKLPLETWRWALAETESVVAGTFSSNFTVKEGLEPNSDLNSHRSSRYVGAIISGAG